MSRTIHRGRSGGVPTADGDEHEEMQRVTWDASAYVGKEVYVTIVDKGTAGWAHVTFDDFIATGRIDSKATEALHASYMQRLEKKAGIERAAQAQRDPDRVKRLGELMADGGLFAGGWRRVLRRRPPRGDQHADRRYRGGPGPDQRAARRHIWQIFKNYKAIDLPHSFFAVRAKAAGKSAVVRAMQTAKEGPFEAMKALKFSGEYPFGWFTFEDPACRWRWAWSASAR